MTDWYLADILVAVFGFIARLIGTSRAVNITLGILIMLGGGFAAWSGLRDVSRVRNLDQHGILTEARKQNCYGASKGCDYTYKVNGVAYTGAPDVAVGEYQNFKVKYLPSDPKQVMPAMTISYTYGCVLTGIGFAIVILGLVLACYMPSDRPGYLVSN